MFMSLILPVSLSEPVEVLKGPEEVELCEVLIHYQKQTWVSLPPVWTRSSKWCAAVDEDSKERCLSQLHFCSHTQNMLTASNCHCEIFTCQKQIILFGIFCLHNHELNKMWNSFVPRLSERQNKSAHVTQAVGSCNAVMLTERSHK